MMSEPTYPKSSIQYLAGGDLESVQRGLVRSLEMNSIPYRQEEQGIETSGIDQDCLFQLYSPRWMRIGRIGLHNLDDSQVLLHFYLPAFPERNEIEFLEGEIREELPPPAMVIRLMDVDGDRDRAVALLGRNLHQFRIRCLQEVQSLLVGNLGLIAVHGLTTHKQRVPDLVTRSSNPQNGQRIDNRDIPRLEVPLRRDQQELLRMWQAGHTAKEIALRLGKMEKTILNQITLLRKTHGERLVPRRK